MKYVVLAIALCLLPLIPRRPPVDTVTTRYITVGLAGFRGIIAEIAWIRADRLQEQGRYMELVQLSDWITALDPRATDSWVFNSWNLAYNISALVQDPDEKAMWVAAGIALLRDKAIPMNADAPDLYRQLGWLYQDKIGGTVDPASATYRRHLADDVDGDGGSAPHMAQPLDDSTRKAVEAEFGELDWHLPHAHAIYWAWLGLQKAKNDNDVFALRRMVRQSLTALAQNDPRFIKPTLKFSEETTKIDAAEAQIFESLKEMFGAQTGATRQ